jgi:hypothetical protein
MNGNFIRQDIYGKYEAQNRTCRKCRFRPADDLSTAYAIYFNDRIVKLKGYGWMCY